MASKIIGKEQKQLPCIYSMLVKRKAHRILAEPVHPSSDEYIKLPSGIQDRAVAITDSLSWQMQWLDWIHKHNFYRKHIHHYWNLHTVDNEDVIKVGTSTWQRKQQSMFLCSLALRRPLTKLTTTITTTMAESIPLFQLEHCEFEFDIIVAPNLNFQGWCKVSSSLLCSPSTVCASAHKNGKEPAAKSALSNKTLSNLELIFLCVQMSLYTGAVSTCYIQLPFQKGQKSKALYN